MMTKLTVGFFSVGINVIVVIMTPFASSTTNEYHLSGSYWKSSHGAVAGGVRQPSSGPGSGPGSRGPSLVPPTRGFQCN